MQKFYFPHVGMMVLFIFAVMLLSSVLSLVYVIRLARMVFPQQKKNLMVIKALKLTT